MNKLSDTEFKAEYNKQHPLNERNARQFVKCRTCQKRAAFDYIPYVLGPLIDYLPCGHWLKGNAVNF